LAIKTTFLALNCGSSSIKFAIFAADGARNLTGLVEAIGHGQVPKLKISGAQARRFGDQASSHSDLLPRLIDEIIVPHATNLGMSGRIGGVGHRVVHGGEQFDAPIAVNAEVRRDIDALTPLAPGHQPHNLAGIDAASAALPGVLQVACFDTAFHNTVPAVRREMALPRSYAREGLLRYGFHGLSYQHVAATLPSLGLSGGRVIACHLGNGSSISGMIDGKSAWTSMGFTPLDGLMMGQRPGRLDPGAVLWLIERHRGDDAAVTDLLYHQSGLAGVSGLSGDMRLLLASEQADAKFAIDMYVDRLVQEIGAAAASLEGCDAIVFSGGIGENSAPIRAMVLKRLSWLGFALDADANAKGARRVTNPHSARPAFIVKADEEQVIAEAVAAMLAH
jgi:acetate kinase